MTDRWSKELDADDIAKKAASSSFLSIGSRIIGFVLQTGTTIALARFLVPADFGVMAMVAPFFAIFMVLGNLGTGASVIRDKTISRGQLSFLFYLHIAVGLGLFALLNIAAPFAADFYREPKVEPVFRIMSLVALVSASGTIHTALLRRTMMYKQLTVIEIASSIVTSASAIAMALVGFGFLTLALREVVRSICGFAGCLIATRWLPGRPARAKEMGDRVSFSGYVAGFSIINSLGRQGDNIILGWRWGTEVVGQYALAYRLFFMPVQILVAPLQPIFINALARLIDQPERMASWYLRYLRFGNVVALPPTIVLAVCAHPLTMVVLGEKWMTAANVIQWLAPVAGLHVTYTSIGWLNVARGAGRRHFAYAVIVVPVYLIGFWVGAYWGAEGVAIAYAATNLVLFLPGFLYATWGTPIRFVSVISNLIPGFVVAIICGTLSFVVDYQCQVEGFSDILTLGLVAITATVCWLASVWLISRDVFVFAQHEIMTRVVKNVRRADDLG